MTLELANKTVIVTGGASGIGHGTAALFVEEGARVVIADVNDALGEEVATSLGASAAFKHTDVSDPDQIQDLVDFTVERFGGLHVMFNNAGIPSSISTPFVDEKFEDFERVMAVNLFGVMIGTQRAARHMMSHGGGSIINTTSMSALKIGPRPLVYSATKVSVIHFSKAVAIELGPYGVRVNCVSPGLIPTPISDYDRAAVRKLTQPLNRAGTPRDVANAALYLASDRSAQVTGTVMAVDGGASVGPPDRQNSSKPA